MKMIYITEKREFSELQINEMAEFIFAKFEYYCANELDLNTNNISNEDYCILIDNVIAKVKETINAQVEG